MKPAFKFHTHMGRPHSQSLQRLAFGEPLNFYAIGAWQIGRRRERVEVSGRFFDN
jgi:hypothetical protein